MITGITTNLQPIISLRFLLKFSLRCGRRHLGFEFTLIGFNLQMFVRPCVQACSCVILVCIHGGVSLCTRHACQLQSCKDSREATCSTITLHTSLFHIGGEWLRSARGAKSLAALGLRSSLKTSSKHANLHLPVTGHRTDSDTKLWRQIMAQKI